MEAVWIHVLEVKHIVLSYVLVHLFQRFELFLGALELSQVDAITKLIETTLLAALHKLLQLQHWLHLHRANVPNSCALVLASLLQTKQLQIVCWQRSSLAFLVQL